MRTALITLLVLLLSGSIARSQEESFERVSATEDVFPLIGWPAGDADAGMLAFQDLKCGACHAVPSVSVLANGGGEDLGPDLVAEEYARPRLALLRQIVVPGSDRPDQVSHMGNFAEVMTVQQLTDIIAFIEKIDAAAK
jgi:mono/diheme cytochrome c family protein